ncbi:unnamed protein product [Closterium sp. Yama58-4]|nr:unnamed protein product [Closterium sp. Yama58-4]
METPGLSLPRCHSSTPRLRNSVVCLRTSVPAFSFSLQPETKTALQRFKVHLARDQICYQRIPAVAVAATAESAADSAKGVKVQITLVRECGFGQAFGVVGGSPELGQWEPSRALQMEWSPGHVWSAQTVLPAGSRIEFKIIMVTENGDIVWQPGPNKTAVVSNGKGKQLLQLPWDNEELPPLPRTADAGAVKTAATALAPEFQEAELASDNSTAKGADEAKAVDGNEPAEEAVVASAAQTQGESAEQAEEEAEKEAREEEEAVVSVEETRAEASPPEPDAIEGAKQAKQPSKKKPVSPTARVLQADAAWGQRVWGSLISSWGRKTLMDEETNRD